MVTDILSNPKLDAVLAGLPNDQAAVMLCGYAASARLIGNDSVNADVILRRALALCPDLLSVLDAMFKEAEGVPFRYKRAAAWAAGRLVQLALATS